MTKWFENGDEIAECYCVGVKKCHKLSVYHQTMNLIENILNLVCNSMLFRKNVNGLRAIFQIRCMLIRKETFKEIAAAVK